MKTVFITNAGPDIGGGHLSRCFALAGALSRLGADCSWILNDAARPRSSSLGMTNASYFADPFSKKSLDTLKHADFAVVDSYIPGADFYGDVSGRTKLVVIDDLHDRGAERFAGMVINYGIGASAEFYANPRCEYLIGPRYALLREEYWRIEPEDGDYVLFAAGAADILGCSADIVNWWREDMGRLVVALGPFVSEESRRRVLREASEKRGVEVLSSPENFAPMLARAGFVVSSASVTAYEALALEKKLAVFSVADNQRGLGEILSGFSVAYDLGDWRGANAESIREAVGFSPDGNALRGLVNKRGACSCAESIIRFMNESR